MEKLYPFELSCVLKSPVWSGTRLGSEWGKGDMAPIGESWELCVRQNECNVIKNGWLAGKTLREAIESYRVPKEYKEYLKALKISMKEGKCHD